ncbi:MAG: 30S ribosomal protein S6 [Candidatus Omnitrophica bacterium]|nr:30S ribosomal protein S6 [Candidatus Omnitrophota bacterium]
MKSYEAIIIVKPDLSQDGLDKTLKQIKDTLEKNKVSSEDFKEMGKQRLAFPIKKFKEGVYYLVNFNMDPAAITNIKRSFNLNETILRTSIVNK